jgi:regulator of cell morphogenesis and NO signaling
MVDLDMPVRDVLRAHPTTLAVFERHRLDYCCGGARALREACASAGADAKLVQAELDRAIAGPRSAFSDLPPESLDLPSLVEHILTTHHVVARDAIATLPALAKKVAGVHGDKDPSLRVLSGHVTRLFDELRSHMECEEQVLFPHVLSLVAAEKRGELPSRPPFGTVANPIRAMRAEHDDAGAVLGELRRLTNDYTVPAGACGSWTALIQGLDAVSRDLMRHVYLENERLFPLALELEARARKAS